MALPAVRHAIAPVAVVAVAFALWLISDRLLYIGPLDRATFGWLVVVPLWAAAPAFAGFSWRSAATGEQRRWAIGGGLFVGGVAATLLWQAAATVPCTPVRTALDLLIPTFGVGAAIAGGFTLACLSASRQLGAGHVGRGLVYGAAIQLIVIPVASIASLALFTGVCQRP